MRGIVAVSKRGKNILLKISQQLSPRKGSDQFLEEFLLLFYFLQVKQSPFILLGALSSTADHSTVKVLIFHCLESFIAIQRQCERLLSRSG